MRAAVSAAANVNVADGEVMLLVGFDVKAHLDMVGVPLTLWGVKKKVGGLLTFDPIGR